MEANEEMEFGQDININADKAHKEANIGESSSSSHLIEKKIYELREEYIKLNESSNVKDIKDEIFNTSASLSLGEYKCTNDFILEETMNSVEINHFKMDPHSRYRDANTYLKLLSLGKIKKMDELNLKETLALIDNLNIRECMWLGGSPIYQTIFSLCYFTDPAINDIKKDNCIFRIYLDTCLHICYIIYDKIVELNFIKEEDISLIPILNKDALKRENAYEELKNLETRLRNELKEKKYANEDLTYANQIFNRIKIRRLFMKIAIEQFDAKYKKRFNTLGEDVKAIKNLLSELKKNLSLSSDTLETTSIYFCDKLHKISPGFINIKKVDILNFNSYLACFEKLLKHLLDAAVIYDVNEFYKLRKFLQNLNDENPSFLVKAILEFNSFPKNESLLFYKINYNDYFKNFFVKELKLKVVEKETEIFDNMVNLTKELFSHSLKNKSRQIRNVKYLFDSLAIMVIEANNKEKEIRTKNKKLQKIGLTNFFIKQIMEEMLEYINVSFSNEIFAICELDYIFYYCESLLNYLVNHTQVVCSKFADDLFSENDWVKSSSKSALSYTQLLFLDQITLYNGLRHLYKGLCLICVYLKKARLLKAKNYSEDEERLRVANRFPCFKNTHFFFDASYEVFKNETKFELSEKEMIFDSANASFKQALKIFLELKNNDPKLREGIVITNEILDNLSKVAISNNTLITKLKKLDTPIILAYNVSKYKSNVPVLEFK